MRLRRTTLGLSQEKLGDAIGLTFQQVQKYERGTNRIGASRLFELSKVLDVPVGFFFEEIDPGASATRGGWHERAAGSDLCRGRQRIASCCELVRIFQRISDPTLRRRLFDLVKAITGAYFSA